MATRKGNPRRGPSRELEAVWWYRRSAEQGHAIGQTHLGWMYEQGRGVRRDRVEAARWYRLAVDQGDADAQRRLDGLRGPHLLQHPIEADGVRSRSARR